MTIDLLATLWSPALEPHPRNSQMAVFLTHRPWAAPEAYLHVVFKPAAAEVLAQFEREWRAPRELVETLRLNNGAHLFAGSLSVFGVVRAGQLLNRSNRYELPPFNIERENGEWMRGGRFLAVGAYRLDGSRACISRENGEVVVFPKAHHARPQSKETNASTGVRFGSLEEWLRAEIERYRCLYDEAGRLVGLPELTGPPRSV